MSRPRLTYSEKRSRFEFYESYDIREDLKRNGFLFDWNIKTWHTPHIIVADAWNKYADASARFALSGADGSADIKTTLTYQRGSFVLVADRETVYAAETLGFRERRGKPGEVFTKDPFIALALIEFADEATADMLRNRREKATEILALSRAEDSDIEIPVPDGLHYYPYQKAGVDFVLRRKNVLIGDEMGLGKTIEAIGVINALPETERILVVCPAYLKGQWAAMLRIWLVNPYLRIGIVTSKRFPAISVFLGDGQISIINYELLGKYKDRILASEYDILIGDEAHYIKNPIAARTKRFKQIRARIKMLLTGTPICNRPKEIFSLANFLDRDYWNSKVDFERRYCGSYETQFGTDASGGTRLEELQVRLRSSVMIRRLKKDVLKDLPEKRRQILELTAPPGVLEHEKEFLEANPLALGFIKRMLGSADAADRGSYKKLVEKIGGVAAAKEGMTMIGAIAKIRHETALFKVPELISIIRDALEEKPRIAFFAHHRDVIDQVAEAFADISIVVYGGLGKERDERLRRFVEDPELRLFCGGITTMQGINELAGIDTAFFGELDYVPGNITQAEDRLHRIGAEELDSITITHVVLRDSIDAYIANMLIEKQEVIDAALDDKLVEF